ncbi:hypothetical protein PRIPAC_78792, partial [Pristionchus pacificus]
VRYRSPDRFRTTHFPRFTTHSLKLFLIFRRIMDCSQTSKETYNTSKTIWHQRCASVFLLCTIFYLIIKCVLVPTLTIQIYSDISNGFQPYHITPTARKNSSNEIAIVIILTKGSIPNEYATALNTLECYSALHGYRLIIEHDDRFPECSKHMDKFFRRHCHTHKMMLEELPQDSWVFFIDADNGIANPERLIDDLIDPGYDIYLYNRFFNWEMAAQYLVKNNERGRDWVKQWAEFEFKVPASTHGSDNGALHVLMMNYLAPETKNASGLAHECLSIWDRSGHINHLFNMESCVRMVIGERTYFPAQRVKIFPKTKSFARDLWQLHSHWSTEDFILHAVKERYFKVSSLDYMAHRFENLRAALTDPSSDIVLPSPLNDSSSCDSVFPLLNKLNIDKCRNGTETWIMDTRLKINEKLHVQMLEQMSDRILKQQIHFMVNSDADPRRDELFVSV